MKDFGATAAQVAQSLATVTALMIVIIIMVITPASTSCLTHVFPPLRGRIVLHTISAPAP